MLRNSRAGIQKVYVWAAAMPCLLLAVMSLYWSHAGSWGQGSPMPKILHSVGSTLLMLGAFVVVWEVLGRRALVSEALLSIEQSRLLDSYGLAGIDMNANKVPWSEMLLSASSVDLFFTYARSWRGQYEQELKAVVSAPAGSIRVALPDPNNEELLQCLAMRFGKSVSRQREDIREAKSYFQRIAEGAPGQVEVRYAEVVPGFSVYRIGHHMVIALLGHLKKEDTPHFICRSPGELYRFGAGQLEQIASDRVSTRVV